MSHPFVYVGCFIKFDTFQSVIKAIRKNPLKMILKHHMSHSSTDPQTSMIFYLEKVCGSQ